LFIFYVRHLCVRKTKRIIITRAYDDNLYSIQFFYYDCNLRINTSTVRYSDTSELIPCEGNETAFCIIYFRVTFFVGYSRINNNTNMADQRQTYLCFIRGQRNKCHWTGSVKSGMFHNYTILEIIMYVYRYFITIIPAALFLYYGINGKPIPHPSAGSTSLL